MNPDSTLDALMGQLVALQRRVDNLVKPEVPRWQDWTPTVTQSGSVAVTIDTARYTVDATGLVTLTASLTVTGTGTAGSSIIVDGIPSTIRVGVTAADRPLGTVIVFDTSATIRYVGAVVAVPAGNGDLRFRTDGNAGLIGAQPSFGLASGDTIGFTVTYERS